MAALFNKLNDPHLVAGFQRFFGVERKITPAEPVKLEEEEGNGHSSLNGLAFHNGKSAFDVAAVDVLEDSDTMNHGYYLRSRKSTHMRYPSDVSTSSKSDTDSGKQSGEEDYTVKYPFFYYLFHVGASLGNEMFYCCFFPYWFWNVDGYVCRRLVLTWCLIMYIGQALKDLVR